MALPPAFTTRLVAALEAGDVVDKAGIHQLKQRLAGELGLPAVPRDSDVLASLDATQAGRWRHALRKKPTRTASGVAVVAVMTSPAACPHGKCVYCPGGPDVGVPQSYTGFEPSTMRAARLDYDPYRIVRARLAQLAVGGHAISKVEVVLQGGTFPARPMAEQDAIVAAVYAACNDGPGDGAGDARDPAAWAQLDDDERTLRLAELQRTNETADCRVVGLTVETKPDWCLEPHVDAMLRHGVTRVELGVQTLDEDVLRLTHRGHTLDETRRAFQVARDAGLKICAHMMPGQPRPPDGDAHTERGLDARSHYRTDPAADVEDVRRLFAEPAWRPDMLKIYPTLVVQEGETPLKRWWKEGRFTPFTAAQAADVVAAAKAYVPEWCRIQRVDRDIPTTHVLAGVEKSNLRQLVQDRLAASGRACRCIRCREPTHRAPDAGRATLVRREYEAAGGAEVFLAYEDPEADAVLAFLRLRRLAAPHRRELQGPRAIAMVRELRVYGTATDIGAHDEEALQHHGFGARLLAEAERITFEEWHLPRLAVIAGVGVKVYYRRHGYRDLGPYVAKDRP